MACYDKSTAVQSSGENICAACNEKIIGQRFGWQGKNYCGPDCMIDRNKPASYWKEMRANREKRKAERMSSHTETTTITTTTSKKSKSSKGETTKKTATKKSKPQLTDVQINSLASVI